MTHSPSETVELIALLRREGRYSGVWFSDHLLRAADTIDELVEVLTSLVSQPSPEDWARAHAVFTKISGDQQ